jgi:hypothetical protein
LTVIKEHFFRFVDSKASSEKEVLRGAFRLDNGGRIHMIELAGESA